MRGLRPITTVTLAAAASALAAAPASATFHEMSIREVYPAGDASYIELQMWAGGQNFVGGHHLIAYDSTGAVAENFSFAENVSNGANQSTIVVADTDYATAFSGLPGADETDASLDLSPAGGAVCWTEGAPPDCVSWGNFSAPGAVSSPTGSPAAPAGVPAGMALRRSIEAGCPTLLERSDDHDNSAADFAIVTPAPRPNSVPPTERGCARSGGQQTEGSGGDSSGAPQTTLKRKPGKKTHDRTPTFRFASDEPGSTFQCKLDKQPFKPCRSPFTAKRMAFGPHTFKVRARDSSGRLDPTPASYGFRIVAKT